MKRISLLMLMTQTAIADDRPLGKLGFSLEGGVRLAKEESFDIIADSDELALIRLETTYAVGRFGPGEWIVGAVYERAEKDGNVFEIVDTSLTLQAAVATARYDVILHGDWLRYLRPFGRAELSANWASLKLDAGGLPLEDRDFEWGVSALGGAEVLIPWVGLRGPTGRLALGMLIEGGYGWIGSFEHSLTVDEPEDESFIASEDLSPGRLDLSGPLVRVGISMRF